MRIAFFVALLAASIFYSYIAFVDLHFLTRSGRLGPGFFPRIIGVASIVVTLWAIRDALRDRDAPYSSADQWRDVTLLVSLAFGYAVLLRLFGGLVATILFLALTLSLLNRGQILRNALVAVLVPAVVYLLFDLVLNASTPPALFKLPI